jgi:hypothetical protein
MKNDGIPRTALDQENLVEDKVMWNDPQMVT